METQVTMSRRSARAKRAWFAVLVMGVVVVVAGLLQKPLSSPVALDRDSYDLGLIGYAQPAFVRVRASNYHLTPVTIEEAGQGCSAQQFEKVTIAPFHSRLLILPIPPSALSVGHHVTTAELVGEAGGRAFHVRFPVTYQISSELPSRRWFGGVDMRASRQRLGPHLSLL